MKRKKIKSKKIKRSVTFKSGHGFIIHGAVAKPLYPTHTHHLTEMGMPEMIFDPLAFGAEGNARRMIDAYRYLAKEENADKLDDLKHNFEIKLVEKDLYPEFTGEHVYTYGLRKVSPILKGVRLAYFPDEIAPDMWFVQMYVEGDDYVLTDEYYCGGVKW
jgi:hypothetical protein